MVLSLLHLGQFIITHSLTYLLYLSIELNIEGWIEFDVSDADLRRAERIAEETRREARKRGLEPIFQSAALENEILGLLGEGKFEDHLKELRIAYEKHRPVGRPDRFDFKIEGKIFSVKTNLNDRHPSRSPDNYKFLVNEAQFLKHDDVDYFVSVMVFEQKAWICGLVSRSEVATCSVSDPGYGACLNIPYSQLHGIIAQLRPCSQPSGTPLSIFL